MGKDRWPQGPHSCPCACCQEGLKASGSAAASLWSWERRRAGALDPQGATGPVCNKAIDTTVVAGNPHWISIRTTGNI